MVQNSVNKQKITDAGVLLFTAFICITCFSASSFIYPLNPWDDANVFMTIGKAMLSGKVLYRDIFDQKGPLLFYLHELAALISSHNFFGIYIIEILCFWGYMWYSRQIMRLFTNSWIIMPLTCLIGICVVCSDFFYYGDSVEELCLPILSFSLYHVLKYLTDGLIPKRGFLFLIGVGMGVIFWMKFTIVVFHLAVICALSYICWRKKRMLDLIPIVSNVLFGFFICSAICISPLLYNGTLDEMFDAYFYTNIFRYAGTAANGEPSAPWFYLVKLSIIGLLVLPVAFTKVRWDIRLLVCTTLGVQLFTFTQWNVYIYYFLVIFIYAPLIIFYLRGIQKTCLALISIVSVGTLAVATDFNLISLLNGTFPCGIIQIAKYVNTHKTGDEDVLTFSSHDTGIYLLSDVLPPNKYYFAPNAFKLEVRTDQKQCIDNKKPKFLIRKTNIVMATLEFYSMPVPNEYKLVCHETDINRYLFLLNPKMFLWNLGYPQSIMKRLGREEAERQHIYLYERRN